MYDQNQIKIDLNCTMRFVFSKCVTMIIVVFNFVCSLLFTDAHECTVLYIENSIQLCKLLIYFNQIVCSHHIISRKEDKMITNRLYTKLGAYIFSSSSLVCSITIYSPMIPINRNRIESIYIPATISY